MRIDDAKERVKLLVKSTNRTPIDESLGKLLERYDGSLHGTNSAMTKVRISGFLSINYAKYYSAKRKNAKNATGSSLKLISYSSILIENFAFNATCTWQTSKEYSMVTRHLSSVALNAKILKQDRRI